MKTAFISDSGCGKSVSELAELGIYSVPLQIVDGDTTYEDLETLSNQDAYNLMKEGHLLKTSLPSLGKIEELFTKLKEEGYERIVAVPICNGLSGTMQAMQMCANQLDLEFIGIDCYVTAVVQEYLITTFKKLLEAKESIEDIIAKLNKVIDSTNTILLPDDLNHLKRGGRLTPMAATLGGLLKIKPILKINKETNGKIDVLDKVRTMSKAMDTVIKQMKEELVDDRYWITVAHADDEAGAQVYANKLRLAFPKARIDIISLVAPVGVHTGRGCQALQYFLPLEKM